MLRFEIICFLVIVLSGSLVTVQGQERQKVRCKDLLYESDCSRHNYCKYYNVDNKDNGYCIDITMSQCYQISDKIDCGQVSTCFWNYSNGLCQNLLHSQGCNEFNKNRNMCNSFNSLCRYEGNRCLTISQYEEQQIERKRKIQEIRDGTNLSSQLISYSFIFIFISCGL